MSLTKSGCQQNLREEILNYVTLNVMNTSLTNGNFHPFHFQSQLILVEKSVAKATKPAAHGICIYNREELFHLHIQLDLVERSGGTVIASHLNPAI